MSSYDESMEDFVVLSDSGSDFEASPKPAKGKAAQVGACFISPPL
jgi:hypothetical protein